MVGQQKHMVARLMDVQNSLPGMIWDVSDGVLTIKAPVTFDEQDFLLNARRMFEPA